MIRLGVNIDHVATLREVRKSRYPDIVEAMFLCERGGADQITVHLREDRRHIQDEDLDRLLEAGRLPINLEMALIPEMIRRAKKWKPYSVTLVPERRAEMTTESGLNLLKWSKRQKELNQLKSITHLFAFIDPSEDQVIAASEMGFDGVEFHTGPYAHAYEEGLRGRKELKWRREWQKLSEASALAAQLGLQVKSGHGLTLQNVGPLCRIPSMEEMNIGHSIVCRSLILGLEAAVREMKLALNLR
jgi:pyridoxine 5-phosphate synthase